MSDQPIESLTLNVNHVDINIESDSTWSPEFITKMHNAGFSMNGGVYIYLTVKSENDDELGVFAYVAVAKRIDPIERAPTNGGEASLPEFMEYMAFSFETNDGRNWGIAMVNALITSNRGQLPNDWLCDGMKRLEAGTTSH